MQEVKVNHRYLAYWGMFVEHKDKLRYNKLCLQCTGYCKQSVNTEIVNCDFFEQKGEDGR